MLKGTKKLKGNVAVVVARNITTGRWMVYPGPISLKFIREVGKCNSRAKCWFDMIFIIRTKPGGLAPQHLLADTRRGLEKQSYTKS